MKTTHKFFSVFLLLVLLLVPTQSVAAEGLFDGPVIFGGSYTVASGETLNSDLIVFGGFVSVEDGGLVNGSVVLIGGNLTIDGEVNGDVVLIGGLATLGETAIVRQSLATVGAAVERAEGALIEGDIISNPTGFRMGDDRFDSIVPITPVMPIEPFFVNNFPFWSILSVFGRAVAMSLLAMLVVLFMAEPTKRVALAATEQPAIAGGLGLLTLFLAPLAVLVLAITIILAPVAILAVLVLLVAMLYGWIALGVEVGARFTKMFKWTWPEPVVAGFGALVLTLISESVGLIPCVGWLAPFVIGTLALGGVIISRFGSQTVLRPSATTAVVVAVPSVDGEE